MQISGELIGHHVSYQICSTIVALGVWSRFDFLRSEIVIAVVWPGFSVMKKNTEMWLCGVREEAGN